MSLPAEVPGEMKTVVATEIDPLAKVATTDLAKVKLVLSFMFA